MTLLELQITRRYSVPMEPHSLTEPHNDRKFITRLNDWFT